MELSPGSRLFFIKAIAPGRLAFGERFVFEHFRSRFKLRYGESLAALENWDLRPTSKTISGRQNCLDTPLYISIYVSAPELESSDSIFQFIHDLKSDTHISGLSRLGYSPFWNVKLMSPHPVELRDALTQISERFYESIGLPVFDLRPWTASPSGTIGRRPGFWLSAMPIFLPLQTGLRMRNRNLRFSYVQSSGQQNARWPPRFSVHLQ